MKKTRSALPKETPRVGKGTQMPHVDKCTPNGKHSKAPRVRRLVDIPGVEAAHERFKNDPIYWDEPPVSQAPGANMPAAPLDVLGPDLEDLRRSGLTDDTIRDNGLHTATTDDAD